MDDAKRVTANSSFIEHLDGTKLRACFDFWLSRRHGEQLPRKQAIDATQIPRAIMPNLFLYERTTDTRFRCRLAGSAIRNAFGREPTGLFLDELVNPASVSDRNALFHATLDRALPVVYGGKLAEGEKLWMPFERLLLPVADDLGAKRFVFGMVIFPHLDNSNRRDRPSKESAHEFEAWATAADLAVRSAREH